MDFRFVIPWLMLLVGGVALLVMWRLSKSDRKPKLTPVQTISERELAARFLNAPNQPLWEAVLASLDLQVQDALEEALEEKLTNEELRTRVGGVAELLRFKAVLLERERAARLTESQAATEAKEEEG